MFLELVFILSLLFVILTFFYKQCVSDLRINQIEWKDRQVSLKQLLSEKIPIVIRGIPKNMIWTCQDILMRDIYTKDPILKDLVSEVPLGKNTRGIWSDNHAEYVASENGLPVWADKYINREIFINTFDQKAWIYPKYYCWYGSFPLRKTIAPWNCLFSSENEILVSLLPQKLEYTLPKDKESYFPNDLDANNTPFYDELKFLDVILRPGNCLLIPSHWIYSISTLSEPNSTPESSQPPVNPLFSIIEYHNPLSLFALYSKKKHQ